MLSFYDFLVMDQFDQAKAVWKGKFLIDRVSERFTVQLYSVSNFFVEVYYDTHANKIDRFKAFKTGPLLDQYLEYIQI